MKRSVDVSPAATVVAVLIGGSLLGVVGALLAIPIAAALQLVLNEVVAPAPGLRLTRPVPQPYRGAFLLRCTLTPRRPRAAQQAVCQCRRSSGLPSGQATTCGRPPGSSWSQPGQR